MNKQKNIRKHHLVWTLFTALNEPVSYDNLIYPILAYFFLIQHKK